MEYLAVAIATLSMFAPAIAEGLVCCHAIDGMSRNPEMASTLRSSMILACALCETTGIYAFVTALLLLFTK